MYNHPPVNGMLYLDLQIFPDGGNTLSTNIVFSPNLLPYTASTDGDYSIFYPEFNLGDIYRGAVEVISYLNFSEPLPEYCTVTIFEKNLQIQYYADYHSTELIGYVNSISDFITSAESNVPLPQVISRRMVITWVENNVLPLQSE